MTSRRLRLATLVASACLTLVACGSDGADDNANEADPTGADSSDPDTSTPSDSAAVTIDGFAFSFPASVPAGSVTIQNNDPAAHTLTDDAGSFDIAIDGSASTTAEIPAGTYQVHCEIHSTMTGTLTVA